MNPEIFLCIFIGLVIFEYCFSTILDYLNYKNWKDEIPENLKEYYNTIDVPLISVLPATSSVP